MASTTPNIGLTLPTGAEKVSRQIINNNNTKIDTAIGTLNGKILNRQNRTYVSTVSAFNEYCTNLSVGVGADVAATGDVMNDIVGINGFGIMSIVKVSNSGVHISYAIAFNQHVGSCVYNFTNSTTTNLNDLNGNFVSAAVDMSGTMQQKFQSIFTIINGRNYATDKSYPVMLYISGSTFNGTFTGTFNISSGGIRFLVADETRVIHGLFRRSDNTILNIEDLNSNVNAIRLSYDTLINEADGGATTSNIPTFNSRKFSDYNLIIGTVVSGSINHSPCILPEYVFRTQGGMQIDYSTDTTPRYASIAEQSDTSAYVSGNVSGSKVNVYGVRIVKE